MVAWAALGKAAMGGLKAGAKKVATDKLLNRKKKTNKRRASAKKIMGLDDKEKEGGGKQRGGALAIRPTMGLVNTERDFAPLSTSVGESDIIIIKKQVIQVRDILKDTHSAKEQERKNLRKAKQLDKKKKEEDKIETSKPKVKPKESKGGMKLPKPGLGIGNFLTWLAIGLIFAKLKELMPAIRNILKILKPIANFIGGLLEKTIGFIVGFIDLAYAGVENLEKLIVAIGGEGAGELFNKFGKLFTQLMNGALIAALVASRVGLFKKPKKPQDVDLDGKPKKPKKPKWQKNLKKWWKKTPVGKFIRNQKAAWKRFTRSVSRGPLGKIAKVLNPKNIGNWINTGGVDKALKGGVRNIGNFIKDPGKALQKIKVPKSVQNLTKNITQKIKPGKVLKNLQKTQVGTKVTNVLKDSQKALKNLQKTDIGKQVTQIGKKVTNVLKDPQKALKNLQKTQIGKQVTQAGKTLQNLNPFKGGMNLNIGKRLQQAGDNILKLGKGVMNSLPNFNKLGKKLGGALTTAYQNSQEWVKKRYDNVVDISKSLKSKFDNALKGAGNAFNSMKKGAQEAVMKKVLEPVMEFLQPLIKQLKGVGGSIMKTLQKIPGFDQITKVLNKFGGKGSKGLMKKLGGKAIPIIGGVVNMAFAYDRLSKGDSVGGLIEGTSGILDLIGLIPGGQFGPPISLGLDAYMFARDFVPQIQEGEDAAINALGLSGFKSSIDNIFSKLPGLGEIASMITGGDKKDETATSEGTKGTEGEKTTIKNTQKMDKTFKSGGNTYDLSQSMGGLTKEEYAALDASERNRLNRRLRIYENQNYKQKNADIISNKTISSEGLNTDPSYGSGGFMRVDTEIYIQPIEV